MNRKFQISKSKSQVRKSEIRNLKKNQITKNKLQERESETSNKKRETRNLFCSTRVRRNLDAMKIYSRLQKKFSNIISAT